MQISPKNLVIKPISAAAGNVFIKKNHYSKKVVPNSQIHLGVFYKDYMYGVLQFGPSINKKGTINLVKGTLWNDFIELNRMAFLDCLPKNSESRCISVALRIIKKHYPNIRWVISFADASQCGDGTIYRAAGFLLTDIRKNDAIRINPLTGEKVHVIQAHHKMIKDFRKWKPVDGYQLRYLYLYNKKDVKEITVPLIPFSELDKMGIRMYKGKSLRIEPDSKAPNIQLGESGAEPTNALQISVEDSVRG